MNWTRVTRSNPCPICGKPDWCVFTPQGLSVLCMRVESKDPLGSGGWMHRLDQHDPTRVFKKWEDVPVARPDMDRLLTYWKAHQNGQLEPFAATLGVSQDALYALGCVWAPEHRAFAFPMRSAKGDVIGIRLRNERGDKWAVKGSRQGLFLNLPAVPVLAEPSKLLARKSGKADSVVAAHGEARESNDSDKDRSSPQSSDSRGGRQTLLIVEGPTDTSAAIDLGFAVIGRPACFGCEGMIAEIVEGGHVAPLIIADADAPGQRGALQLQAKLRRAKVVTLPCKDLRAFKNAGGTKTIFEQIVAATF